MKKGKLLIMITLSVCLAVILTGCKKENKGSSSIDAGTGNGDNKTEVSDDRNVEDENSSKKDEDASGDRSKETSEPGFDIKAIEAKANAAADDLRTGNYEAVSDTFDETMKEMLPTEDVKASWEQVVKDIGSYVERISTTSAEQDGYLVVIVLERFENNGLSIRFVYDNESKLAGFFTTYQNLSNLDEQVDNDYYKEEIITVAGTTLTGKDLDMLEEQMKQVEADVAVLRGDFSDRPDNDILMGIAAGYWKSLKENQGMNYIDKINLPILVLQGKEDFQVYPEKDFQLWVDTITDRPHTSCLQYKGLNHLMMPSSGVRAISDYDAPAHVDKQVIQDIAFFVAAQQK